MDKKLLMEFEKHLERAIDLLENKKINHPSSMIDLILKRYGKALELIRTKPGNYLKEEEFHIHGSTRAYLEAYSDSSNPALEEMYKSEKILEELFKKEF